MDGGLSGGVGDEWNAWRHSSPSIEAAFALRSFSSFE